MRLLRLGMLPIVLSSPSPPPSPFHPRHPIAPPKCHRCERPFSTGKLEKWLCLPRNFSTSFQRVFSYRYYTLLDTYESPVLYRLLRQLRAVDKRIFPFSLFFRYNLPELELLENFQHFRMIKDLQIVNKTQYVRM